MTATVLLIGKDESITETMARLIKTRGCYLIKATGLDQVASVITNKCIDVVLIILSGFEKECVGILNRVKRIAPDTETIVINDSVKLELSIKCMKAGAFDDFYPPFDLETLSSRIMDAAKKKIEAQKHKKKISRFDKMMMAISFAEAGELTMAKDYLCEKQYAGDSMDKIKLLLVDDEEDFVKTLSERIKIRKLGSKIAFNGEEALEMIDNQIPDVMILDIKMPGIDGMEVLRRVKSNYPNVQVIILTGHGTENEIQEALRLGAFASFQKPVDIDVLMESIINAYKKKNNS